MKITIKLLLILLLFSSTSGFAESFDEYKVKAEAGNSDAQFHLGEMYKSGEGVAKDSAKAAEWYKKAADQGNAIAQQYLGLFYYLGEGVAKDPAKAVEWSIKSAEQGNAIAQNNLGFFYESGFGVAKDSVKAVEWYTKAAQQGNPRAQYHLGKSYLTGEAVLKDPTKAAEWYKKAADQGDTDAQANLGWLYESGKGVSKDPAKAFELYKMAADQGYNEALNRLGWLYESGTGVEKDPVKAAEWYKKAADQGNVHAKYNLTRLTTSPNPSSNETHHLGSENKSEQLVANVKNTTLEQAIKGKECKVEYTGDLISHIQITPDCSYANLKKSGIVRTPVYPIEDIQKHNEFYVDVCLMKSAKIYGDPADDESYDTLIYDSECSNSLKSSISDSQHESIMDTLDNKAAQQYWEQNHFYDHKRINGVYQKVVVSHIPFVFELPNDPVAADIKKQRVREQDESRAARKTHNPACSQFQNCVMDAARLGASAKVCENLGLRCTNPGAFK